MTSNKKVCRNCGTHLAGAFCSNCGQKQISEHDKTFSHFVHDVVHEVTHVDSKVFGTFWTLLTKPGVLTEDYWAGRLGKWIRPLRLFVVISTIHFLLVGGVGPLNMSLHTSRDIKGNVKFGFKPGKTEISSTEKSEDKEFREKVDQKSHKVYTWLRYSSLLALATVSFLLFRKRQPYFVDHLVSAMHVYSFQLLISIGLAPLILLNYIFSILLLICTSIYILLHQLRLFPEGKAISILKSVLLFLVFVAVENVFVLLLSGIIAIRLVTAH